MFRCPRCAVPLQPLRKQGLCIWGCPKCEGRLATVATLRRILEPGFVYRLWSFARERHAPSARTCPGCRRTMRASQPAHTELELDACLACQFVWFDADELERAPEKPAELAPRAVPLSPAAREAAARLDLSLARERAELDALTEEPDSLWKTVFAGFGMPVTMDDPDAHARPWLTWLLAAACVAVSLFLWLHDWPSGTTGEEALGLSFGSEHHGDRGQLVGHLLQAIVSTFAHADALHLAFNLYFLLLFGPWVEEALGGARTVALFLLSALVGAVLHFTTTAHPELPLLGASGGIAGLLAWCALSFPRLRIGFHFWPLWRWSILDGATWLSLSVRTWFVAWLALQVLGALYTDVDVSHAAHIGGALAGLVGWLVPRLWGLHGYRLGGARVR